MVRASNSRAGMLSEKASRLRASDGAWVHDKAPAQANGATFTPMADKLIVSNLHYEILPKDLISIFGQIGTLVREPIIKYDRSGRSTGVAFVQFETSAEATRAMRQFSGVLAKGQPMKIDFDKKPLFKKSNDPKSLMNRVEKPPLLDRLNPSSKKVDAVVNSASAGGRGAVRSRILRKNTGGKPVREKKAPKTAADLDSELDGYMGDGGGKPAMSQNTADGDVEMAT